MAVLHCPSEEPTFPRISRPAHEQRLEVSTPSQTGPSVDAQAMAFVGADPLVREETV